MRTPTALFLCLAVSACKASPPPLDPKATVRFLTAEEGEVAPQLVRRMTQAKADQRRVLVYVSAPWCEPCRVFHTAVDRGELTGKLGALDLVAFDAEPDAERLLMSGYEQRFIPAFHVPGADGRASAKHLEGSVNGAGAVADLVPRILELLK
ncbi:MAG: thioredoxin family protein [Archangium sp.]|nr:thioredoxin family protein [Archangium sp.]